MQGLCDSSHLQAVMIELTFMREKLSMLQKVMVTESRLMAGMAPAMCPRP